MIRYPGSKAKILREIVRRFPDFVRIGGLFSLSKYEYREPFFGAGAAAKHVLRHLGPKNSIWLNDKDYGLICLWIAIRDTPDELCDRVRTFSPSVEAFYEFKKEDGKEAGRDPVETGFRKLALHQISFSGLGARAGGPIGGRLQSSEYNVSCRWNPSKLCREISTFHRTMARFESLRITSGDFSRLIVDATSNVFLYIDPPYVDKGPALYKHSFVEEDHRRLADTLKGTRAHWVLSYDDHPLIRELYSWALIDPVTLTYTTAVAKKPRRKNSEILIYPRRLP